jgi:hypothetical protein
LDKKPCDERIKKLKSGTQEIGPNDKDMSTFDSPLEALGHHFQTRF